MRLFFCYGRILSCDNIAMKIGCEKKDLRYCKKKRELLRLLFRGADSGRSVTKKFSRIPFLPISFPKLITVF